MKFRQHMSLGLNLSLLLLVAVSSTRAQQLEIHHIDVDQGDATLFVMPNGTSMLVDAGLDSKGEVVGSYLDSLGITQLDAFVLTHYDGDHMGGVDVLGEEGIEIAAFYDHGGWNPVACDEDAEESNQQECQYQEFVVAEAGSAVALAPGDQIVLDSAVSVVVVAANAKVHRHDPSLSDEKNAKSVTLLVTFNGFNYLLGGDLTADVEERLVSEAAIGDIDAYHVNHHGSESSSSRPFLRLIRPEVAIVSAGSHCGHHHPRQTVLDAIREESPGVEIFQTNRYECEGPGGNVDSVAIGDLEPEGSEGAILITVGDEEYTVIVARTRGGMLSEIERPN